MADKKISALTAASTPLAGTEVLPIVQGGSTVKVSAANITAGRAVGAASLAATDFVSATNYVVAGTGTNIALLQPKNLGFYNAGVAEGTIKCSDDTSAFVSIGLTKTTARFATGNTDRLSINAAGNVTVNTGNLVIGTADKGIDFSANSSAAGMTSELLNDYEEGTFTPGVAFGGASVDIAYAFQIGQYVKVGRAVTLMFGIGLNNIGSSTGGLSITGLPFAAANTTYFHCSGINAFNWASGTIYPVVQISDGATSLGMVQLGTDTSVTNSDVANGFVIRGIFNYIST